MSNDSETYNDDVITSQGSDDEINDWGPVDDYVIADNGANLLCLGKLIKKLQQSLALSEQWKEFQRCGQSDIEDEIVELDAHDQEFDFEFDFNDDMHAQIDSETRDRLLAALNDISDSALLIVFSCAAHTVQLAVHDVLSYIQRANINRIRRVPTKLLADIELTADDFHYMQQFTEAFEPVYKLTLALQAEQLAMSDVIIHWYRCKGALLKLSKGNEFTELLNDAFDRRTKLIMENPLLATAAYVDPRLNHKDRFDSFLGDLKPICEERLMNVLKRIHKEKYNKNGTDVTENITKDRVGDDDDDELDRFMDAELAKNVSKSTTRPTDEVEMLMKIKRLGMHDKISMKSSVFSFYENLLHRQAIDDDIFEAVTVVLSAPATQVSVERAFSALALLMDDLRCNLLGSTIDNILLIGLNRELVPMIDFDSMHNHNSS
ncbi:hypothetical protein Bhyg_09560 [Pseudolycoriella hygida]|uniref:HAT C-terminal dimerisation domain-containing protein n=1 Tax=Pseudolycoriella hygida TaxID=35572 RepID=A0A9Q0N7T9_9DIPT|nr:hypothetical protein Bhyg_09560 [Pseudolycoriella hygida]